MTQASLERIDAAPNDGSAAPDDARGEMPSGTISVHSPKSGLADRLRAAVAEHTGVFIVTGAMGIGKTGFARYFAHLLKTLGYRVLPYSGAPSEAVARQVAALRSASPVLVYDDADMLSDEALLKLAEILAPGGVRVLLIGRPLLRERLFQPGLAPMREHVRAWDRLRASDRPAVPVFVDAPEDAVDAEVLPPAPIVPVAREMVALPNSRALVIVDEVTDAAPMLVAVAPVSHAPEHEESGHLFAKGLALAAGLLVLIALPFTLGEKSTRAPEPVVADIAPPEPPAPAPAAAAAPQVAVEQGPANEPDSIEDLIRAMPPAAPAQPRQQAHPRARARRLAAPQPTTEGDTRTAASAPHCAPYTTSDTYIGAERAVVRGTACRDAAGKWWLVSRVPD